MFLVSRVKTLTAKEVQCALFRQCFFHKGGYLHSGTLTELVCTEVSDRCIGPEEEPEFLKLSKSICPCKTMILTVKCTEYGV